MIKMITKMCDHTKGMKEFVENSPESYETYKEVIVRLRQLMRMIDNIETVIINKDLYQQAEREVIAPLS